MNPSASEPRLLDGNRTTVDWQTATTRIAVLPIGAFEQHGGRLPLATDTLMADYFAARLARSLDAALLPALPYATSLEHTGFRGSISLRPDTAMALVRALVASLEQQHFRRLVIVNGHGGNFFLGPVLREINAQDRSIKVLTVDCSGAFDTSPEGRKIGDGELHAGASEISRLMAVHPDVVGPADHALPLADKHDPHFQRSDLNTFGIGVRDPSGVWGDPAGGDVAIGRIMNESIAANQLRHVRERLAWLDAQPGYAGSGGLAMRTMNDADIVDGLRLCRVASWNQRRDDWRLFRDLQPSGAHVAVHMGAVVGTVATLVHGFGYGWIGMVLVDPERRRFGIGTRLLKTAMESLAACPLIGLDATAAGKAVYDRLGFVDRYPLARMIRRRGAVAIGAAPASVRVMTEADLPAVIALDAEANGVDRAPMVRWLFTHAPTRAWVALGAGGVISGFALGRPGENFDQIGPIIAHDHATAIAVLQAAIGATDGKAVGVDIYPHPEWLLWLERTGFVEERRFMRMTKGTAPIHERLERLFAIAGPELS